MPLVLNQLELSERVRDFLPSELGLKRSIERLAHADHKNWRLKMMPLLVSDGHRNKVVTAREAVNLIRPGDTVATGGLVGIGFPECIAIAVEQRFLETREQADGPKELTLVYAAGQGDGGERGLNHFGHEGLLKRIVGGHWGLVPRLQSLALNELVEAYNLPQGVILSLYRDVAARKPGTLSLIGLGTFVDPRLGGGKMNRITTEDLVQVMPIGGVEYLFYRAFPINVAIIRATTADADGNLTMEREAVPLEGLSLALAAHNSGGIVIAQVERITERGHLHPRNVTVPGVLVDCVVLADHAGNHMQTFSEVYNPAYAGDVRVVEGASLPMPLNARKVMARRAALELEANAIVNLGIGIPEGVASIAAEEQCIALLTLTAESGTIGGIPAGGLSFGAASNAHAVLTPDQQFAFYDGGGLDIAFLGMAQVDRQGNVNVSKFGPKLAGAGGFVNISQATRKIVFMGSFRAGASQCYIAEESLAIRTEGETSKFVEEVAHITFSGKRAVESGQDVLFVTERCVFQLTEQGLELHEVAPGVDIERDILRLMDFQPIVREAKRMDAAIFRRERIGLRERLLTVPIERRLAYVPSKNTIYINLEGHSIKGTADVEELGASIAHLLEPLGTKVFAIVNYDHFNIAPDAIEQFADMVEELVSRYYLAVTRYTTSGFLRAKLGDALSARKVAPHLFERAVEAEEMLKQSRTGNATS